MLTSSPHLEQYSLNLFKQHWRPLADSEKITRSSANIKQDKDELLRETGSHVLSKMFGKSLTKRLNRMGLKTQPCFTPTPDKMLLVNPCVNFTA